MRDVFYKELKKVSEEIYSLKETADVSDKKKRLMDTFNKIIDLSLCARKEGMTAVEEKIFLLPMTDPDIADIRDMMQLVTDGADPGLIWDICMTRYFASELTDYEGLRYLMMLQGILAIQNGDNPYVVENKLIVMLPEDLRVEYESSAGDENSGLYDAGKIESLCEGGLPFTKDDNGYIIMKLADCVFRSLDDSSVRRLLQGWDSKELCVCIRGLSGAARKRIFDNLSNRLALMVVEEMEYRGPIRVRDVVCEMQRMLIHMRELMQKDVIHYEESEAFDLLCQIYDDDKEEETGMKIAKLHDVFREYASEGRCL